MGEGAENTPVPRQQQVVQKCVVMASIHPSSCCAPNYLPHPPLYGGWGLYGNGDCAGPRKAALLSLSRFLPRHVVAVQCGSARKGGALWDKEDSVWQSIEKK